MKSAIELVIGCAAIFISMPIWFYLQYKVLQIIGATELMWFLFWVYVPTLVGVSVLSQLVKRRNK